MSEHQAKQALTDGTRVRVTFATPDGLTRAEGTVVGYCPVPQVCIVTDDGHHVWWRADLTEPIENGDQE